MKNSLKTILNLFNNTDPKTHFRKGFTLIELLVVISIIGILASVVLASLEDARAKAMYSRAAKEMQQFHIAVMQATGAQGSARLMSVTGSGCSACQCPAATDLRNIDISSACYQRWATSLNNILTATNGVNNGLEGMMRDPWGSPYLLDENEGEQPANYCLADSIISAGRDGIRSTSDDYALRLSYSTPQCMQ